MTLEEFNVDYCHIHLSVQRTRSLTWQVWVYKCVNGDHIRNRDSSGKSRGSIASYFSGSVRMIVKGYIIISSWIIASWCLKIKWGQSKLVRRFSTSQSNELPRMANFSSQGAKKLCVRYLLERYNYNQWQQQWEPWKVYKRDH